MTNNVGNILSDAIQLRINHIVDNYVKSRIDEKIDLNIQERSKDIKIHPIDIIKQIMIEPINGVFQNSLDFDMNHMYFIEDQKSSPPGDILVKNGGNVCRLEIFQQMLDKCPDHKHICEFDWNQNRINDGLHPVFVTIRDAFHRRLDELHVKNK